MSGAMFMVMWTRYWCVVVKRECESEIVELRSHPHLWWSWTLANGCKNQIVSTSSGNELPLKGVWAQPCSQVEELSYSGGAQSRVATLLHWREATWADSVIWLDWTSPVWGVQGTSKQDDPEQTQDTLERLQLTWEGGRQGDWGPDTST